MKIFLARPDAAFYHITRRSDWENGIQERGLLADKDGQIFVSRSADEGILASVAINQLLELDEEPDLVVLKLTQAANQFQFEEFSFDKQSNETTFPFHNIIRRPHIPLEHIELERHIQMPLSELGLIADQSDLRLPIHPYSRRRCRSSMRCPTGCDTGWLRRWIRTGPCGSANNLLGRDFFICFRLRRLFIVFLKNKPSFSQNGRSN